ncbi:hypothetical protein ACFW6S_04350 [Streptomyces sp. NPDC058740]|uniref:hypothetical protein n=1 Tax=Streptomyces sp. NPDC058740 TaxID=3346619 RepID=UPI0036A90889
MTILRAIRRIPIIVGARPLVVHGACRTGVDAIADHVARRLGYAVELHPARGHPTQDFGLWSGQVRVATSSWSAWARTSVSRSSCPVRVRGAAAPTRTRRTEPAGSHGSPRRRASRHGGTSRGLPRWQARGAI